MALIFKKYIWSFFQGGAACLLLACCLPATCCCLLLLAAACCCLLLLAAACCCLLQDGADGKTAQDGTDTTDGADGAPTKPATLSARNGMKVFFQFVIPGWIGQQTSWELSTTLMHIAPAIDLVAENKGPPYPYIILDHSPANRICYS